ncbi:5-methylthioribose kinase [plant metagenome]|uniref:5-methylthioribose kinase n=1 Tax=plant metagenome TaxID=1297885 RepID=A0A484RZ49_9ZZZZ
MEKQFLDLAEHPQRLKDIFVRLGLADSNETPAVSPLTGGVSSGILRVDVRRGSYCLKQALPQLKVEKVWKVPLERAFTEVQWLRTVAAIQPGCVPTVLGEDRETTSFVMAYLGEGHRNWKADLLNGQVDIKAARQVGDALGKIHAATAKNSDLASRFATDDNFYAIRLEPYLVETARVHPTLAPRLQALVKRTQERRIALVHGDVSPKNILLGPQGPVFLDAECAWYGDPAFDLAFVLNHLMIKAMWMPPSAPALLSGFDALRAAYFKHIDFEPQSDLDARTTSLLPALALARVDGKSPVEYLDEHTRQRLRAASIRLIEREAERLSALASYWMNEVNKA